MVHLRAAVISPSPGEPTAPEERGLLARVLWASLGLVAVGIGSVGIVVPGLPSTVFFIVAAWAFARSSPRLEAWLLNLPRVGPLVRDYRAGLGMPRSAKATAVVMIVVFVGLSAWLVDHWMLSAVILLAGVVGVVVVLRVPTKEVGEDLPGAP